MPASIGVNLRVTGHCRQGGRKYMEDFFSVAYQQTEDEKDLEYAFFGIYDGHGGAEAAAFAKEHLMETIIKHKNFWSDYDEDVLRAIKDGYIATHYAMWKEQEKWPRTASGLPSTAGTTASVAFIRRGKIYIGHVGDSGIILGYQEPGSLEWKAKPLTRDHKPENVEEMSRIEQCGGKVVAKSGVPRVVWNRPKIGHQGPVRRSTPIDEIPFLAVARSLGDLWSYNSQINQFIVSPDPDCSVLKIDTNVHRCLIFGTDGLYNMLSPMMAVHIVQQAERHNENAALSDSTYKTWLNPSKLLVERALERWHATKMRADNTSVVTLMLDPPGPPRAQVLKDRKKNLPERGLRIMTRFDGNNPQENNPNNCDNLPLEDTSGEPAQTVLERVPEPILAAPELIEPPSSNIGNTSKEENAAECSTSIPESTPVSSSDLTSSFPLKERNFLPKTRESTSFDPREPVTRPSSSIADNGKENLKASQSTDDNIQCNEISSSNIEADSTCEDEAVMDSTSKISRRNLRSAKTGKNESKSDENGSSPKTAKRKLEADKSPVQPRKSMRIDHNQRKAVETVEKERRAFEAEEKLKRLAEKADLARKTNTNLPQKLSLAQKILKSKNINLKKKNLVKKPITKKKIQMVLETMTRTTTAHKASSSSSRDELTVVRESTSIEKKTGKLRDKIITTKISRFRRHSKKNVSQRQRNAKSLPKSDEKLSDIQRTNKVSNDRKDGKDNTSSKPKNKAFVQNMVIPKKNSKSSSNSAGQDQSRSLRSSTNRIEDTKESESNISVKPPPQMPKMKESVKVKTLRKKIQQKTESLRRNVLRSKSKDMEPGREGGMWFGFAIKDLENGKGKKYCIAALLNVTGEKIEHGDGRGRIVKDYLTTNLSFDQYVKTLEEVNFSGFNFVGIEISKDDCQVYHYSNTPKIFSVYSGKETLGFGNSPTYTPLTKVTKGRYQFEEIISRGLNNEELVEELLKLLKNETKHLPDEELEKRNPAAYSLLSSIFVKIKDPGYGTRAHSILLIDYNWNFQFIEHALKQPIDIENPEWNINKIQSRL